MKINVFLSFPGSSPGSFPGSFPGTCEEALQFHQEVLGGELLPMRYYDGSPAAPHTLPGWEKKVMHGALETGDIHLMGSDLGPDRFEAPRGVHLSVNTDSTGEAERIFGALADGRSVTMPLDEVFRASRFGMLTDRYGIHWMVNCV